MHRLVILLALAALVLPGPAAAWTDARPAGLVTELAVDRDGGATVTLRLRWRVLAGRLHQFDLAELPTDLALLEASAVNASGAPVAISTRSPEPGRLEVSLGEGDGGLRRGTVDVVLRYATSLRAQGAIRRAGHDAVIEVATVPWERGLEATEVRVALPASARRAQWIADDTPGVDATTTTELSRDVVRALRRHLPPGTRWTARVAADPNLFPWLASGAAHDRHVRRAAPRRVGPALAFGAALALALLAAAALLARGARAPYVALPGRAAVAPAALVVAGGVAQSLALLAVPGALATGTLLLLAAVALRAPRPRPLAAADPRAPARRVDEEALLARTPRPSRALAAGVAALALAAGALGVWAARHRHLATGVVALDLALAAVALVALRHAAGAPYDAHALLPVVRAVARLASRARCARIAWRVRGDAAATGSVRARLVPRPGWRLARGVRAVEWAVALHPGTFGWRPVVVTIVRVEPGSPLERALRLLATRAGAVAASPDGDLLAYTAEMVGPDRAIVLKALRAMLPELFVRAPDAASRSIHLGEVLAATTAP